MQAMRTWETESYSNTLSQPSHTKPHYRITFTTLDHLKTYFRHWGNASPYLKLRFPETNKVSPWNLTGKSNGKNMEN